MQNVFLILTKTREFIYFVFYNRHQLKLRYAVNEIMHGAPQSLSLSKMLIIIRTSVNILAPKLYSRDTCGF